MAMLAPYSYLAVSNETDSSDTDTWSIARVRAGFEKYSDFIFKP
jgi:hypothetical protein